MSIFFRHDGVRMARTSYHISLVIKSTVGDTGEPSIFINIFHRSSFIWIDS